jgi:hypothetical protein
MNDEVHKSVRVISLYVLFFYMRNINANISSSEVRYTTVEHTWNTRTEGGCIET